MFDSTGIIRGRWRKIRDEMLHDLISLLNRPVKINEYEMGEARSTHETKN